MRYGITILILCVTVGVTAGNYDPFVTVSVNNRSEGGWYVYFDNGSSKWDVNRTPIGNQRSNQTEAEARREASRLNDARAERGVGAACDCPEVCDCKDGECGCGATHNHHKPVNRPARNVNVKYKQPDGSVVEREVRVVDDYSPFREEVKEVMGKKVSRGTWYIYRHVNSDTWAVTQFVDHEEPGWGTREEAQAEADRRNGGEVRADAVPFRSGQRSVSRSRPMTYNQPSYSPAGYSRLSYGSMSSSTIQSQPRYSPVSYNPVQYNPVQYGVRGTSIPTPVPVAPIHGGMTPWQGRERHSTISVPVAAPISMSYRPAAYRASGCSTGGG